VRYSCLRSSENTAEFSAPKEVYYGGSCRFCKTEYYYWKKFDRRLVSVPKAAFWYRHTKSTYNPVL